MSGNYQETASIGAVSTGNKPAGELAGERLGDLSGQVIGDYAILEKIGQGGNGVVYRARQQTLDRDVVIKVLRVRAKLGLQSQMAARFLREAQLASGLDHPYAAHIYDFGIEPSGVMWIAMELVNGTALNRIIYSQGALPVARLVPLLEKICEVVHTAHSHGIVHRDLKPSNIMVLSRAGQLLPKLLDFGIARRTIRDESDQVAAPGTIAPTAQPAESSAFGARAGTQTGGRVGRSGARPESETDSVMDSTATDDSRTGSRNRLRESKSRNRETGLRLSPVSLLASAGSAGDTPAGASLGSPMYMAPEQWRDAAHADERADQYALGVLTYEALTGRLPFVAKSTRKLAAAHADQPIPKLGAGFSPELEAVVSRALAKNPQERFDDVLAFARALRSALPHEGQVQTLINLDQSLVHLYLEKAPQPLADAVASADAATDLQLARRAISQVLRVGFGLLGAIALAAVARLKTPLDRESDDIRAATDVLRRMRRERLTTGELYTLIRGLTQPFADQPDVHLIPELVLLTKKSRLAEVAERDLGLAARDDFDLNDIRSIVPDLEWFLTELAFLCEYPLVVSSAERVESWIGARRAIHPFFILQGSYDPPAGEILLTGANREPVLILSPLLQKLEPAPLRPAELFVLFGGGRYGALMIAFPTGFERYARDVWPWLDDRLTGGLLDAEPGEDARVEDSQTDESPPYMGLSAFSRADADRFFGREREVEECVNRLRVESFLAVVGPSGAGKSSFVQAGVLPALPDRHRVVVTRPGARPLAALARACREQLELGSEVDTAVRNRSPDAFARVLRPSARGYQSLVLVIDQFEELITLCTDPAVRRHYAGLLLTAAGDPRDPVRVIITLRDDFLLRAQQIAPLSERLSQSLVLLATPPSEQLERILIEPAAHAGYEFDDPHLPAEMVAAVASEPSALALLSFTASLLWARRDRQFRRLQRRVHDELGGVGGALARHAESTLTAITDEQRGLVREIFRQLVTADGTRAILTRGELFEILGGRERAQPVLEALIGARLLVASEGGARAGTAADSQSEEGGDEGEDEAAVGSPMGENIEVVHEALLSSWPRLVDWQREDSENARLRDQLRAAARQWRERERSKGLLWRGDALMEYRVWRARYPGALTNIEDEFATASVDEDERGRRLRRLLWGAALAAMAVVVLVVALMNRNISAERDRAAAFARAAERNAEKAQAFAAESQQRLVEMQREQGRQALLAGEPLHAFTYLYSALEGSQGSEDYHGDSIRFMLARAMDAMADQQLVLLGHNSEVIAVQFSPDGRFLASSSYDHSARIWDASTGAVVHTLTEHSNKVWDLAFNGAGDRLATASWDKTAIVWDVETGARLWTAEHDSILRVVQFSADGSRLLTGSGGKNARVWRAEDGQLVRDLGDHDALLWTAALDPTGRYVVTGAYDQIARVWEVESGRLVFASAPHGGIVNAVAFSPDGATVASASINGSAMVFPKDGPTDRLAQLVGHDEMIMYIGFSPTGSRVVTASGDGTAKLWDVRTGKLQTTVAAHEGGVTRAIFTGDEKRMFTFGRNGQGKAWSGDGEVLYWTYTGHRSTVWSAALTPDGERLATAGFDSSIRMWNARQTAHIAAWPQGDRQPDGSVAEHALMAPNGRLVATIFDDGTIQIWARDGRLVRTMRSEALEGPYYMLLTWHPDSSKLLSAGGPVAIEWDVNTGTPLHTFAGQGVRVSHAIYSSDADTIVTSGDDGTIRVHDAHSGAPLATLAQRGPSVRYLDVTGDGRLASAVFDNTIRFYSLADRRGDPLVIEVGKVPNGVRFAPDGTRVVVAALDKSVHIYASDSGKRILTLEGHKSGVRHAAFSHDGRLIATASEDRAIKVWDASSGLLLWSFAAAPKGVPIVDFTPDGNHIIGTFGAQARLWRAGYEQRDIAALAAYGLCRVDYELRASRLVRRELDYSNCHKQ